MIITRPYAKRLIRTGRATEEGTTYHDGQRYQNVTRHDLQRVDHYPGRDRHRVVHHHGRDRENAHK